MWVEHDSDGALPMVEVFVTLNLEVPMVRVRKDGKG